MRLQSTSAMCRVAPSLIIAFANDIPVVATKAGGIPESVLHEKTGFLSEIGDYKNLAQQVVSVLTNETLRLNLTKNAKVHLNNGFTKSAMAKKTLDIYSRK